MPGDGQSEARADWRKPMSSSVFPVIAAPTRWSHYFAIVRPVRPDGSPQGDSRDGQLPSRMSPPSLLSRDVASALQPANPSGTSNNLPRSQVPVTRMDLTDPEQASNLPPRSAFVRPYICPRPSRGIRGAPRHSYSFFLPSTSCALPKGISHQPCRTYSSQAIPYHKHRHQSITGVCHNSGPYTLLSSGGEW